MSEISDTAPSELASDSSLISETSPNRFLSSSLILSDNLFFFLILGWFNINCGKQSYLGKRRLEGLR